MTKQDLYFNPEPEVAKEIVSLSREIGFEVPLLTRSEHSYYMWLLVLQLWLIEYKRIYVIPLPTITCHWTHKIIDIQCDPSNPIERPPYKGASALDYGSIQECLQEGIKAAIKQLKL